MHISTVNILEAVKDKADITIAIEQKVGFSLEYLPLSLNNSKDQGGGHISIASSPQTCNPLNFAICQPYAKFSRSGRASRKETNGRRISSFL